MARFIKWPDEDGTQLVNIDHLVSGHFANGELKLTVNYGDGRHTFTVSGDVANGIALVLGIHDESPSDEVGL